MLKTIKNMLLVIALLIGVLTLVILLQPNISSGIKNSEPEKAIIDITESSLAYIDLDGQDYPSFINYLDKKIFESSGDVEVVYSCSKNMVELMNATRNLATKNGFSEYLPHVGSGHDIVYDANAIGPIGEGIERLLKKHDDERVRCIREIKDSDNFTEKAQKLYLEFHTPQAEAGEISAIYFYKLKRMFNFLKDNSHEFSLNDDKYYATEKMWVMHNALKEDLDKSAVCHNFLLNEIELGKGYLNKSLLIANIDVKDNAICDNYLTYEYKMEPQWIYKLP